MVPDAKLIPQGKEKKERKEKLCELIKSDFQFPILTHDYQQNIKQ